MNIHESTRARLSQEKVKISDLRGLAMAAKISLSNIRSDKSKIVDELMLPNNLERIIPFLQIIPETLADTMERETKAEKNRILQNVFDESTKFNRTLGLTFVALMFYIFLIVAGTTDLQLFLPESTVRLPIVEVELPLVEFYYLTPFLILVFHFNLLINLKHHQEKHLKWENEVGKYMERIHAPFLLNFVPSYVPSFHMIRIILALVISISVFFLPIINIILMQWKFGAYHDFCISSIQFAACLLDFGLILGYFNKVFLTIKDPNLGWLRRGIWVGRTFAIVIGLAGLLCWSIALDLELTLMDPMRIELYGREWIPRIDLTNEADQVGEVSDAYILRYLEDGLPEEEAKQKALRKFGKYLNLQGRDFRYAVLDGVNLTGANLKGCRFDHALIRNSYFALANLDSANFSRANLEGSYFTDAIIQKTNFMGAILDKTHFERCRLDLAILSSSLTIRSAHFEQASLFNLHLEMANFISCHFEGAKMNGIHLEGAQLAASHFEGAMLAGAHLECANLLGSYLEGANLFQAHLENANLMNARLEGSDMVFAHLEGANLCSQTWTGEDLLDQYLRGADLSATYLAHAKLPRSLAQAVIDSVDWTSHSHWDSLMQNLKTVPSWVMLDIHPSDQELDSNFTRMIVAKTEMVGATTNQRMKMLPALACKNKHVGMQILMGLDINLKVHAMGLRTQFHFPSLLPFRKWQTLSDKSLVSIKDYMCKNCRETYIELLSEYSSLLQDHECR